MSSSSTTTTTGLKQLYKESCTSRDVKCNSAVFASLPDDDAATVLTNWDISNLMIGSKGLGPVLDVVAKATHLTSLNLSGNNLASLATKDLLERLVSHPSIHTLSLKGNDIRLGGPELVELVKRNRRIKSINIQETFLRPLFVRLIDIQLRKNGGEGAICDDMPQPVANAAAVAPANGTTAATAAAASSPTKPSAEGDAFSIGGGRRGNRGSGGGVKFGDEPSQPKSSAAVASSSPQNTATSEQEGAAEESPFHSGARFSFGDAAADHDEAFHAAEEEAFGNFRQQISAVHFDADSAGGKKVPRRPTVCSEVYKEEEIDNFVPEVIEKDPKVKQYLLSLLERHDLFSHLEDFELSVAVDAMYERENSKGDTLYEEGDESDTFYVIYSGSVQLSTEGDGPTETKKKGSTMQDLMLLYPGNSRETATCLEDSMLYTLDRQTYRCILSKASKKKRAQYEGFLSTIGFLKAANLTRSELLSLADALKSAQFEAGGSLIKYGEVGETFYIITEGVVEVYGRDDNSNVIKVCEFTVGDCVGELEFINNHKCVADVKAKGFVRVAKMNRHHFEMVMGPVKDVLARNASENTVYEYYRHQLEKMEAAGH
eukprot:CAMPEP_0176404896 /NCGR_PEP_ID=MMETSP0127-20121128/53_1 /TAXON_ID=938130 /ORGANISM="Platyophrya macrostoma, Strain WH" /LENGTH=600 /DNA_ID=CAMNT_0017783927 /DNA_START=73 /DNA_END=1875 /DNA_ORIENTATION=+